MEANRHTITGHARLARNTSGDENNLGASEAGLETLGCGLVPLDRALGVDVTDISSDTYSVVSGWRQQSAFTDILTWAATDIVAAGILAIGTGAEVGRNVQCKLGHSGVQLHQQGQRLSDSTTSTEDNDFRGLQSVRRIKA